MCTHEQYINAVAGIAMARLSEDEQAAFDGVKLVYGAGAPGTRGITYYKTWRNGGEEHEHPFVEVCAFGEQDWVQLAGTTIHELGHVLTGADHGHDKAWKEACERLGLRKIKAAGHRYLLANFEPTVRNAIAALPKPTDGAPLNLMAMLGAGFKLRPCGAGRGARGGKSRGPGSGSRLRKCECGECGYVARVTSKWIDEVGAPHCPNHGAMNVEG